MATQIVFSSNRGGRRLSVWEMSAVGDPGMTQLTSGDESDLWPMVDSDPKPRLFYEALVDTRSDPRLYMTQLGANTRTELTRGRRHAAARQPQGRQHSVHGNQREDRQSGRFIRMPDRGGVPSR